MSSQLSPQEYRDLIVSAIGTSDSDSAPPTNRTLYTPPGHRSALDPNVSIVLGGRGVGKTAWFLALLDNEMREIAAERYQMPALKRVRISAGFGAQRRKDAYPGQRTLDFLLEQGYKPIDIWYAVALHNFGSPEVGELGNWNDRVAWVKNSPEDFEDAIERLDMAAGSESVTRLLLFDAMDLLHSDRAKADLLTTGALQLALELRTQTRNLRAKLFLRHDMLESADTNFTDASKLITNLVDLRWESSSLYSLLFHLMASAESSDADKFREEAVWQRLKDGSASELQYALSLITTEFMGGNHRKGRTFTWIPNHLMDGLGQVSPRSLMTAISKAADETKTNDPDHPKALHWDGIRTGVQHASTSRVKEVKEDIPWVGDVLDSLRGASVPIEQSEVLSRWQEAGLSEKLVALRGATDSSRSGGEDDESSDVASIPTGPSSDDFADLLHDLKELGVFTTRADGRLDLPDVYRLAFGVGRKGGVPLARGVR